MPETASEAPDETIIGGFPSHMAVMICFYCAILSPSLPEQGFAFGVGKQGRSLVVKILGLRAGWERIGIVQNLST